MYLDSVCYYASMKSTCNGIKMEMKSRKLTKGNFLSGFEEMWPLKNNVYQDCLLVDDDYQIVTFPDLAIGSRRRSN